MTKCDGKSINTLNCSNSNCIYLITCYKCSLQYVEETVHSQRGRFSGNRAGMKNPFPDNKCKIVSKYFGVGLCRNVNSTVNIIEKLYGSWRYGNGLLLPGVTVKRQKNKTKWMFSLKTVCPYGLNDRFDDGLWKKKKTELLVITSYHFIVYTNVQIIFRLKSNLIILS